MTSATAPSAQVAHSYRNFIGGDWVASTSARATPNLNPADVRDVLGTVPLSTAEEARQAVAAAKAAFPAWRDTPAPVRGAILYRAWTLLQQEREAFARLLTREEGKTLKESLGEVARAGNVLEFFTELKAVYVDYTGQARKASLY